MKPLYNYFTILFIYLIMFSTSIGHTTTYEVKNIEINEPYSIYFKKKTVIDKAFIAAFKLLMARIIPSDNLKKIDISNLDTIKPMIDSFSITDEKFINKNYSAKFDVLFEKKQVLSYLNALNIVSSIPKFKKILFLPILVDLKNNELFLYQENIIHKNWNNIENQSHLLNYSLLTEDLENLKTISNNLNNIENFDFNEILHKYNEEDYIVSIFFRNDENIQVLSKLNLDDKLSIVKSEFLNLNLNKKKDLKVMVEDLKIIFENKWKKVNEINSSIKLALTLSVDSKNIKLLKQLEKEFNKSDLINSYTILKFSNLETIYKVIYNGTPDKFISNLKRKNFKIDISNKNWIVYE